MPKMNQKLQRVIERVQTWPEQRQEDAAEILAQAASPYRLTAEQIVEVERRLADPNPKFMTLAQLRRG